MQPLPQRTAHGVALAALAVACVVVGPAPRLLDEFERTYLVAVVDQQRDVIRARQRRTTPRLRRRWAPRPARPVTPGR